MPRFRKRSAAAGGSHVMPAQRLWRSSVPKGCAVTSRHAIPVVHLALLALLLAVPATAGPAPFLVPEGAVKLFADDFDSPKYALNTNLWTRITGKPDWQLQVGSPAHSPCSMPGQGLLSQRRLTAGWWSSQTVLHNTLECAHMPWAQSLCMGVLAALCTPRASARPARRHLAPQSFTADPANLAVAESVAYINAKRAVSWPPSQRCGPITLLRPWPT